MSSGKYGWLLQQHSETENQQRLGNEQNYLSNAMLSHLSEAKINDIHMFGIMYDICVCLFLRCRDKI